MKRDPSEGTRRQDSAAADDDQWRRQSQRPDDASLVGRNFSAPAQVDLSLGGHAASGHPADLGPSSQRSFAAAASAREQYPLRPRQESYNSERYGDVDTSNAAASRRAASQDPSPHASPRDERAAQRAERAAERERAERAAERERAERAAERERRAERERENARVEREHAEMAELERERERVTERARATEREHTTERLARDAEHWRPPPTNPAVDGGGAAWQHGMETAAAPMATAPPPSQAAAAAHFSEQTPSGEAPQQPHSASARASDTLDASGDSFHSLGASGTSISSGQYHDASSTGRPSPLHSETAASTAAGSFSHATHGGGDDNDSAFGFGDSHQPQHGSSFHSDTHVGGHGFGHDFGAHGQGSAAAGQQTHGYGHGTSFQQQEQQEQEQDSYGGFSSARQLKEYFHDVVQSREDEPYAMSTGCYMNRRHGSGPEASHTYEDRSICQRNNRRSVVELVTVLLDGHDGDRCVNHVRQSLPNSMCSAVSKSITDDVRLQHKNTFKAICSKIFLETDGRFFRQCCEPAENERARILASLPSGLNSWQIHQMHPSEAARLSSLQEQLSGGCTGSVAVIAHSKVMVGNVGDTRVVLTTVSDTGDVAEKVVQVSVDHDVFNADEQERLERLGLDVAKFQKNGRMGPVENTRAFGDYSVKQGWQDVDILQRAPQAPVICEPSVGVEDLPPHWLLFLMTDGVYKAVQECAEAFQLMPELQPDWLPKGGAVNENEVVAKLILQLVRDKGVDKCAQAVIDVIVDTHAMAHEANSDAARICRKLDDLTLQCFFNFDPTITMTL